MLGFLSDINLRIWNCKFSEIAPRSKEILNARYVLLELGYNCKEGLGRDGHDSFFENIEDHSIVIVSEEDFHKLIDIITVGMPFFLKLNSWSMWIIIVFMRNSEVHMVQSNWQVLQQEFHVICFEHLVIV